MRFEPPNLHDEHQVVIDTETTGVDWKKDHVVGYVVALPGFSRYFPVRHLGGGNYDPLAIELWLSDLCKDPKVRVIGHALKFDLHMLANHGIAIKGPTECTMVNAALIDENQGYYNLDFVSGLYPDLPRKRTGIYEYLASKFGGPADRSQMTNFHKLAGDDPQAVDYAAGDGATTLALWERQQAQLDQQGLWPVHRVECDVIKVLFAMERRGVRVNEEKLHEVRAIIEAELERGRSALPKDFNVRSPKQIAEYLKSHGAEGWPTTALGNDSFTQAYLASIPTGQPILRVRKLSNLLNTFVDPLTKEHVIGGRVHTTFHQLRQDEFGTVTGRLSSASPNMQQVPKRDKELAPLFRQLFLPEDGHQWSANDYNQQELRVFADYTRSPRLIAGYSATPPLDIHRTVAEGLAIGRDPAKTVNFGIIYWIGHAKLARMLGVAPAVAQQFMADYDQMIPEAKRFLREAQHWAKQRGWVRTKLHRRRRFPDWRLAYKAGNAIIQGTSADMTKAKMVAVHKLFKGHESALMLQVHDELDWSVAPGEEHLDKQARQLMESFGPEDDMQFTVPMVVEGTLAENWAAASFH